MNLLHYEKIILGKNNNLGKEINIIWLSTYYEKRLAFNSMLQEAANNDIKSIIFLTMSASHNSDSMSGHYFKEMEIVMNIVDLLACSLNDASSVRVSVVDWARLTCPTIGNTEEDCPIVHGFEEVTLSDGMHPSGDSGLWLTRTILSVIMEDISQHNLPNAFGSFFF